MKSPIETFSYWVENGKDDGMEKNHFKPVSKMLNLITENQDVFSIIDAGCGNGWTVRKIAKHQNCEMAIGVDGSELMINKAKKLDSNNKYFLGNLLEWKPKKKVSAVKEIVNIIPTMIETGLNVMNSLKILNVSKNEIFFESSY